MYEAFVAGIPSFLGETSGTAGRERVHEIPTSVERPLERSLSLWNRVNGKENKCPRGG